MRNNFGIHLGAPFENVEDRDFACGPTPTFPFAVASKVTLVNLDFAGHWRDTFQLLGDDGSESRIKQVGGIPINSDQFRRRPGRCPRHKVFEKSLSAPRTQTRAFKLHRPSIKNLRYLCQPPIIFPKTPLVLAL
jgi:hypothetical protein